MGGVPRAVVTGLGAVSGFGGGVERLFRALVAGERAVREAPSLQAAGIANVAAFVPGHDPLATDGADFAREMALAAAEEAVQQAGGVAAGDGLAVAVGTTLGSIAPWLAGLRSGELADLVGDPRGWTWSGPAAAIAERFEARGPVTTSSVACASGNAAIGAALELIRSGRAKQVIAGGVDALSDFVCAGFASLKALDPGPCRPFDGARRGLNLGEGACFLVVEEEAHARARGAPIRARLEGWGAAADANHMTGPDPTGLGAMRAMAAALADAGVQPDEVGFVSAHGTATNFNDAMEAKALAALLGERASRVPVHSVKGALGHTLGAAGALEAAVCVLTLEEGRIAPTAGLAMRDPQIALDVVQGAARELAVRLALSTSSGFGGVNAAIVLSRP